MRGGERKHAFEDYECDEEREQRARMFRLLSVWCENNSAISTPHGFICCTRSHLNISTPLYSLLLCLLKVLRAACVFVSALFYLLSPRTAFV